MFVVGASRSNHGLGAGLLSNIAVRSGELLATMGLAVPEQARGAAPEERRFSRFFRGRGELIDHILVSHALVGNVEAVDTHAGEPPSISEDRAERRDQPGSDHLPVVVRFRSP